MNDILFREHRQGLNARPLPLLRGSGLVQVRLRVLYLPEMARESERRASYGAVTAFGKASSVDNGTFRNYEKIAESSDEWHLDEAAYRLLEKIPWVVTEKIHGANFCFVMDGQTIRCANRKHLLGSDEDFFQYQVVLERLRETLWQVFRLVKSSYPQVRLTSIYGELFGGYYPHPDVQPNPSVEPVQTGVWYSPSLEFCAFDLAIEGEEAHLPRTYVDYEQAMSFFQQAGLFYAAPLLIGSYQEALAYPLGFRSTIPGLLGLPPLQEENKAEGVVIKPLKTIMIATNRGSVRPVLKRKIAEFTEDKRFHQAQKWISLQPTATQSNLDLLMWEVFNLVTENRLDSALSKLGSLKSGSPKKAQQIFNVFVEDVLDQLEKNQEAAYAALSSEERSTLLAYLQDEARKLLKARAQNLAKIT